MHFWASDIPPTHAVRGIYPDLHAPKGTKRIGETNRVVWKSALIIHTALPNIRKWIGTFHKLQ